jgi:hypothetical protein
MPQTLDHADRNLLIGAGVLLLALVIASALLSPQKIAGGAGYPSTYSPSWDDAKAAYLLLQDLGYQVERWEQPPMEIGGEPDKEVLILADPVQPPTSDEQSAIRDFLHRGGCVVATGSYAAKFLPDAAAFEENDDIEEKIKFPALLPSPLVVGAPEITLAPPKNWKPWKTSQLVIYGNDDTAAVISYSVGNGQVIWWGADTPLTNGGIREAGNLALFLNSVGPAAGRRILWDEYFHGTHGSLWAYFARTPLPWVALQVAVVFLAILATYSRRNGPVRMPLKPSRLSPLEFVDTLGDLYASAHAGSAAVRIAYQRLRYLLTRQLGLSTNVTAADLARTASQSLAWEHGPLYGTLNRAERGMRTIDLQDEESLQLVQEIFDYTARLETRRPRTEERQNG